MPDLVGRGEGFLPELGLIPIWSRDFGKSLELIASTDHFVFRSPSLRRLDFSPNQWGGDANKDLKWVRPNSPLHFDFGRLLTAHYT